MTNANKEQSSTHTNGVNRLELHQTINAVRENPKLGASQFRVRNQWLGQALNESEIGNFFCAGEEHKHISRLVYQNDEGKILLGGDIAANPVEFILHGLAGCLTTTTVYHAAANGIQIEELETTL